MTDDAVKEKVSSSDNFLVFAGLFVFILFLILAPGKNEHLKT